MLHRARDLLVRQRGSLISSIRAHFAEFGIVVGQGIRNVERLLALLGAEGDNRLPALAAEMLGVLAEQLRETAVRVSEVEIKLLAWHRANPASRRLESIPKSARLRQAPSLPLSEIRDSSNLVVNLPLGLASFHSSDRAAVRSGLAA